MKAYKHLIALLAAAGILSGCGGGGGGGGTGPVVPPPPPPPPSAADPLAITTGNANQVIASDARAAEVMIDLSNVVVDFLIALAESGMQSATIPCASGSVDVVLNDVNGNGLPSADETAQFSMTSCATANSRFTATGQLDLELRSFVVESNTAAKAKVRVVMSAPVELVDGGVTHSVSGAFEVDYLGDNSVQTLSINNRFGDEVAIRTVDGSSDSTDTISEHQITRAKSTSGQLSTSIALSVENERLVGSFSCVTNSPLVGPLGSAPNSGQLQCTGASSSAARATSSGSGAVAVTADEAGNGTFVDAGTISGGSGIWEDFFAAEVFAFSFSVPGTIPDQLVPTIASVSAAFAVNDIVASPVDSVIYITDDAGVRAIDAVSLAEIAQVALPDVPGPLAISDDGTTLWVGFLGAPEIESLTLPALTPNGRVPLGAGRSALQLRVAPGETQTVVVSMTNNRELVAYAAGVELVSQIDDPSAPVQFEFTGNSIVGLNPSAAGFPAATATLSVTGVTLDDVLTGYGLDAAASIAKGTNIVSTSGRIIDPLNATIVGRLKLDQVLTPSTKDGVTVDADNQVIYLYDGANGLLEGYFEASMRLRGAYNVPAAGTVLKMLDTGPGILIATSTELHVVQKSDLAANRNSSPCQAFNLSGQIVNGFFTQIDCGFNDALYDAGADVIYATLPSFAGVNGNSLAIIDPALGTISNRIFVGSEPDTLAMSSDGAFMYVALAESNRVAVVDLQMGEFESYVVLEPETTSGTPVFAKSIDASPSTANSFLIGANNHLAVYTGGVRAANTLAGLGDTVDVVYTDGSRALAHSATDILSELSVDASGITLVTQHGSLLTAGSLKLQDARLYDRDGNIVDAGTLNLIDSCSPSNVAGTLLVEPSQGADLIYYIDQSVDSVLTVCDETTFTNVSQSTIPTFGNGVGIPKSLDEVGADRLVMTSLDKLILFEPDGL